MDTYPCLVVSQKILVIALQGKGPTRKGTSLQKLFIKSLSLNSFSFFFFK